MSAFEEHEKLERERNEKREAERKEREEAQRRRDREKEEEEKKKIANQKAPPPPPPPLTFRAKGLPPEGVLFFFLLIPALPFGLAPLVPLYTWFPKAPWWLATTIVTLSTCGIALVSAKALVSAGAFVARHGRVFAVTGVTLLLGFLFWRYPNHIVTFVAFRIVIFGLGCWMISWTYETLAQRSRIMAFVVCAILGFFLTLACFAVVVQTSPTKQSQQQTPPAAKVPQKASNRKKQ